MVGDVVTVIIETIVIMKTISISSKESYYSRRTFCALNESKEKLF